MGTLELWHGHPRNLELVRAPKKPRELWYGHPRNRELWYGHPRNLELVRAPKKPRTGTGTQVTLLCNNKYDYDYFLLFYMSLGFTVVIYWH